MNFVAVTENETMGLWDAVSQNPQETSTYWL
jgi:hypothetical protein